MPEAPTDGAVYGRRGSTGSWSALPGINAANYGVVADGTTDNTAAMQAAINAAQTSNTNPFATTLLLPKGRILTGPLTISGQLVIEGVHDNSTVLVLKDGSTAACITISPAGTAPNPGDARRTLTLRNLRIENQTWYTGNAAAHGINLTPSGAWQCHITLSQVTVYGMPGSGINGVAFLGWVELYDCSLFHNGLYGADCNSCFDWKWFGGDIALNGVAGARLSGCGSMVWSGTNCYSNALYNLQLFSAVGSYSGNHRFCNCNFDRSNQVGVYYDLRDVQGAVFEGCTFTNCSTVTPNTYSDVLITASANNLAVFTACVWGNNNANDASYQEKWALEFSGTTQTVVLDGNNTFWGGTHRTNGPTQIFFNSVGGHNAFKGPIAIVATQQFTGLNISNGINTFASLGGFDGTNDRGTLSLSVGGTAMVSLSAASGSPSFINVPLYLGNGATNATPAPQTLAATGGSGTDIAGAGLLLTGGIGTGAGAGGSIFLRTAPAGTTGTGANTPTNRLTIDTTGLATFANNVRVNGNVGFYNTAPAAKPTVSGAKGSNAALASLLIALAALGLVTDTTTA